MMTLLGFSPVFKQVEPSKDFRLGICQFPTRENIQVIPIDRVRFGNGERRQFRVTLRML